MKRSRLLAVVGALTAILIGTAFGAGLWFGLPIAGGPSYCSGSVTAGVPGTASTCVVTVPAGTVPAFNGNEKFPFDTGLANGVAPQTQLATTCQIAGGSYSVLSPPGATATLSALVCYYIVQNTGTISTLTMTLPAAVAPRTAAGI